MAGKRPQLVWRACCAVLIMLGAGCGEGITEPRSEHRLATRAVDRWVAAHRAGWQLDLGAPKPLQRAPWSPPCSETPHSGLLTLRYATGSTEIDLAFRCPIHPAATVQELQAAFSHAVLQELPHGIRSRGWRFRVLTPSSSVAESVVFDAPVAGWLRVTVHTPLYAVYGHSTRPACQPPADAPSPEHCYVSREHRVPLELRLLVRHPIFVAH